jgi:hypothetical protein
MNGQTMRTATLQGILSYGTQWNLKFFFTPTQLASFALGTAIPISIEFRSGSTLIASKSDPINMNGNSNLLLLTYNSVNQTLSGSSIATGIYNSVSNPISVSGNAGSLSFFVIKEQLGSCPGSTPATCSDGTNIAGQRNLYCQKFAALYSVCVNRTTEISSGCRTIEFQLAVSGVAFIDTVDVVIASCSTPCQGNFIRYNLTIYAPEKVTLYSRMGYLDKAFNTQTFPGFYVSSFEKSDGSSRVPAFILFVMFLVMLVA